MKGLVFSLAGALGLVVVAFASTAAQQPAAAQTPAVELKVGDMAPDFTLQTLDGKSFTLSSLRGKVVLLNFWFPT